jgi:hypothetical protein
MVALWRPSFLHFGRLHVRLFVSHDLRTEKRRKSLYIKKKKIVGMEKNKICSKSISLATNTRKKEEGGRPLLLIGCMEILFLLLAATIFWPGLFSPS